MSDRKRVEIQNRANLQRIKRLTYRAWNLVFESLRSCCVKNAPLLAFELFQVCAVNSPHVPTGTFDGPRAWRILVARIHNDGERTSFDKNFYKAALAFQESYRLTNGSSASEYQRRAFAFIQHIMPNLPQKYEPEDASEYLLNLMPPDLYEPKSA